MSDVDIWTSFDLYTAPVVSISPESICANKTEQVMFTCSATGGPGNTFRWEEALSGGFITDEEVLTIVATKTQEFICIVENAAGSDSGTATLSGKATLSTNAKYIFVHAY